MPAKALTGTPLKLIGTVLIHVKLDSKMVPRVFTVCEDDCCPYDGILGIEFQRKLEQYSENFKTNTISIPGGVIKFYSNNCSTVSLIQNVKLPPRSSTFLPFNKIQGYEDGDVLIEPRHQALSKRNICTVNAISKVSNGVVSYQLTNDSYFPVVLYKNTRIADCYSIYKSRISNIANNFELYSEQPNFDLSDDSQNHSVHF